MTRLCAWMLLAGLGLVGCESGPTSPTAPPLAGVPRALPPGTVDTVPPSNRPAYHPVEIHCVDTVLAPGHVLECEADPFDNARWRYVWTIEPRAGTYLSGAFGPRFRWQAPDAPGEYLLRLRVEPRTADYTQPVDTSRPIYVRAASPDPSPDPSPGGDLAVTWPPATVADNACHQGRVAGGTAPYTLTSTPAGGWGLTRAACTRGQAVATLVLDQAGSVWWSGTRLQASETATLTITDTVGRTRRMRVTEQS